MHASECGFVSEEGEICFTQNIQELGVALMKAQAKQIFDHATLATRRRFTSSRERPGAAP